MDRIFDIGVIVVVAIIIALVTHEQTAQIINATGTAFANSAQSGSRTVDICGHSDETRAITGKDNARKADEAPDLWHR